ncbi:ribosomal RNA small subunit methyltransferase B [Lactobacillus nasalidis]|uniref:16S rRNA (cytosine(967)-C(5))-methyltransferase n=1 Tax=Lactobacillus nasalidis TaxID=2797258 RepID=A0ABQ3W9U6_9LACO|nr:16S rRNA (cytosine(967)-C(5))-methyltransferase RsmB [Lactobacillus nasalidis]GHV97766.1 ribosomal RNA small subunit methyltransferase B [Lactobacillus nasalidis]GHW00235.1 ribosomal RNA small subunit methyltransferase B [Lactobacillus nasalidis]GHW01652.1 ribosomal RNA small subunit methyltransferase B [Lactobacillus nasalidis]
MKTNARTVALDTLMKVINQGSYSNISLNHALKAAKLPAEESRLATNLVYGTIQYQLYLEYQLRGLVKSRLKEAYLKPLLLMSAYQIFFLDKVPDRAVLDEANKLAKAYGRPKSNGFRLVNGILRALLRQGEVLPDPASGDYLSVKYSMPVWLSDYFTANWGRSRAEKIMASFNSKSKNEIRVSRLADEQRVVRDLKKAHFDPKESPLAADSYALSRGGIVMTDFFKDGEVTVQDEAASLVAEAFEFKGNEQALDACSAPGGKTIQLAEQLPNGRVTALDIHEKKLRLVKENAARMHVADRLRVKALDARKATEYFSAQEFDKILVDAPCSGLGLLRRKPEIRYTKTAADLENLAKIQLDILNEMAGLLKKGGELVYSTCSISVEENEENVRKFLAAHPDFALKPFKTAKISAPKGMLKILPDSYNSDGFFIAKFTTRG